MEAYAAGNCRCQICEVPLKRDAHNTVTLETGSKPCSDIHRTAQTLLQCSAKCMQNGSSRVNAAVPGVCSSPRHQRHAAQTAPTLEQEASCAQQI